MLTAAGIGGVFALPRQWQGALTKAVVALEEYLAKFCQPFQRVMAARCFLVTVRPVVIPGQENEGVLGGLEQGLALDKGLIATWASATLEIPVVYHEGEVGVVDFLHEVGEFGLLFGIIGEIPD